MTTSFFNCDEDIERIGRGLFDRTLPKSEWTHAGHFAAALWLLERRPGLDPFVALPPAIRAYNEATGVVNSDTTGYHETITVASIRAARAFAADRPADSLVATCNALLRSPLGTPTWMFAYWSRERLHSTEARRTWVEPDVAAFPW